MINFHDCDSIAIMGKRPVACRGPVELSARAAFAAICWHHIKRDLPIICVEGFDLPDTPHIAGAEVAKQVLIDLRIPEDQIVAVGLTNCTIREVQEIKKLMSRLNRARPLVITHPYHQFRTTMYLKQVGIQAQVLGCSKALASILTHSGTRAYLPMVKSGEPTKSALVREHFTESLLIALHYIDCHGKIERYLADRIRGGHVESTTI